MAVVADSHVDAGDAQIGEDVDDHVVQRDVSPVQGVRPAHGAAIRGDIARQGDLDGDQGGLFAEPGELPAQLPLDGGEARFQTGVIEIGVDGLLPELAAADGRHAELDLVDVDVHPEDAPGLTVEGDRSGRAAGSRPADGVELLDQPARTELADQVGHGGDAEAASVGDVMAAAGSVIANVAKNLGQISLPQVPRAATSAHSEIGDRR